MGQSSSITKKELCEMLAIIEAWAGSIKEFLECCVEGEKFECPPKMRIQMFAAKNTTGGNVRFYAGSCPDSIRSSDCGEDD